MEAVASFIAQPLLTCGGVPPDFEVGWVPQLVCLLWTREKSLTLPDSEQQLPNQPANSLLIVPVILRNSPSSMS